MEKPIAILKPNSVNALIPIFLKNFFYSTIFLGLLFLVGIGLKSLNIISYPTNTLLLFVAILLTIFSLIPTIYKFVILYNIKYHFFKTHVLSEFKLLKIDRKSIPYSQVVNITTNISLWDRLCKAGDIILHTADDEAPNLTLYYIDDPVKVEQFIYGMIKKTKSSKF